MMTVKDVLDRAMTADESARVDAIVARYHAAAKAVRNPDEVDGLSLKSRNALALERKTLAARGSQLKMAAQFTERADTRIADLRTKVGAVGAMAREFSARLAAIDPAAIRDPHEQRRAYQLAEALRASLDFLRRGQEMPGWTPEPICEWLREYGWQAAEGFGDAWSTNKFSTEWALSERLERVRSERESYAQLVARELAAAESEAVATSST